MNERMINIAIVLDGKKLADGICEDLKMRVNELKKFEIQPELTIVTSGDNEAGKVYVRNKVKRCEEIGIKANVVHFDYLTEEDVDDVCAVTSNPIIFQMPITGNFIESDLNGFVHMTFDADGFVSLENVGALACGLNFPNKPCTPKGIMQLLDEYDIELEGKTVCVIGRSNIVGRPVARMMEQRNATVIQCHSKTPREVLLKSVEMSDIIVSAAGVSNVLTYSDMFHFVEPDGMSNEDGLVYFDKVFVDVGINRDENGKLRGDFDPEIFKHCKAYTPVPGGIGPMTVAMLMENVVEFYERNFL